MIRTALTERLGVALPIIGAPMGGIAHGALARAVTEGGGLGMLGVGSGDGPELIDREAPIASAGGCLPFGIGLMAWRLDRDPELLEHTIAARPALVSVSFGSPEPFVQALHDAGIVVASQVHDAQGALAAVAAGVDIVVAQGTDAGGHTGTVGTLPLLQLVLDAVDVPVVAAGGIGTARGLAAVLAAGAAGAWVGTCLLACPEAAMHPSARDKVLASGAADTVLTRVFDVAQGLPWPEVFAGRALRNRFTDRWHGHEQALAADADAPRQLAEARKAGDYDTAYIYAGQAVGLVRHPRPAAEVVRALGNGAEAILADHLRVLLGDGDGHG
jgi:nitronate monooxygenase